jgi:large subunit ribosomal protein L20
MARVKGGVHALKKRRKVLKMAKGYRHGRSTKERLARENLLHAGRNALRDRRKKKSNARAVWNINISAAAKENNTSYSKLMGALAKKNSTLNRKVLAEIAALNPQVFARIVKHATA